SPDTSTLFPSTCFGSGGFTGPLVLNQSGTYVITMTPNKNVVGTASVTLYDVPPDPSVTLPMNGSATVQTTVPGQSASFTFSGTSGQNVSVYFNNNPGTCNWTAGMLNPDGSVLIPIQAGCIANLFFDKTNLGINGT